MNCQPISINTTFQAKKSPIGDWNSLSKYRPFELEKKYTELYDELNRLHRQAFWDGVFSVFNGGSTHDIDFSRLRKIFNLQRSRIYKNSGNAIRDAWKKVGDTLSSIMGGK